MSEPTRTCGIGHIDALANIPHPGLTYVGPTIRMTEPEFAEAQVRRRIYESLGLHG